LKIGTRTRYGLRTILEIAGGENAKGVFQKDIALNQELSNKYLDHIIHALKTAGLINTVKGKKSGYKLSKSPETITVYDVYQAFEPGICLVECVSPEVSCNRMDLCLAQGIWKDLNLIIINYLKSITLADIICNRVSSDKLKELA
jgi:Rrf2 family protein